MTDPPKPARFRVALSFPGEHRSRVETIALVLADRLGPDRVLYDRWYAAEFARPNLDVYLPKLYFDQSDLVVFFLCKEYDQKEWCGLEWRAGRARLKHKDDDRLMFLRLDDADIPGLYSIDGYLDIRSLSDADVAAEILARRAMLDPPAPAPKNYRTFISKLPTVDPTLIGRDEQLAFLDRAWANPATNFVQIIAAGGTGKTALMDRWFRRHQGEATIFGWSFYSQGTSEDRQTSSEPFFAEMLSWLKIDVAPTASIYTKAEAAARRLREERMLLILDGVEPLQNSDGTLRDLPLKALLQELDAENKGMVLCTTRVRMDIPDDPPRAVSMDLDNLTPEHGAAYLRHLNVQGTDEERRQASRDFGNHALALTLLGTYLADFCDGDIRRRVEIRELMVEDVKQGEHARRMMAAYERMFEGKPEASVLRALGYFDRPAEPAALKLVLPAMEDRKYRAALKRLHNARLILTADPAQPIDCHPLVREHFAAVQRQTAPEAFHGGHSWLYDHYSKSAPHRPDTLEEMTPLFYAVYHGCQAGRHTEVLIDIYQDRILRGDKFYLMKKLGAFGTNLLLLANFFETPWTSPVATLLAVIKEWIAGEAGLALRAVGRLADAVEPIRVAGEGHRKRQHWKNASISRGNLSSVLLALGRIQGALSAARESVDLADLSGDAFQRMSRRTVLANALHQSGDPSEAERLFAEAEFLQQERGPDYPLLTSRSGYWYCDLLLGYGQTMEVLRRAGRTLLASQQNGLLQDIGLDHLSLGRAYPSGSAKATHHLDQAIDFFRRSGQFDDLPLGLLARGTPRDLEEAFRIATRSGMRLHLTDYYLISARRALENGDTGAARSHFEKAEALVNETGYHRRDPDLQKLREALAK